MPAFNKSRPDELSAIQIREIALAALVDERTLARALSGRPVRVLCRERIRRELQNRGLVALLPRVTGSGR